MLAVTLVVITVLFFQFVGYRFYAALIDRDCIQPDDNNETPAIAYKDGIDYDPAKRIVLFGHHFASIAGAGPIIGPIVAVAYFGWFAAFIWILIGNVFIGAVHDYLALMMSVRNKGCSIAKIAEDVMGRRAKLIFSSFLVLALILIVAVFGVVASKALVAQPAMVFPTFALMIIAVFFGEAVYRKGFSFLWCSVIAVVLTYASLIVGYYYPVPLPAEGLLGFSPMMFWFVVLMIYAGIASILPVSLLLQPRDYISSYLLYGILLLGLGSLFVVQPEMNAPAFTSATSDKGPIWPMLFVLIACGAVSGFHSLVASGTTSKQLEKESDGRFIGYGSMLTEGILALLALIMVSAGLYWVTPEGLNVDMNQLGFHETMKQGGYIMVFSNGFGNIVNQMLPFLGFTISSMIAIIALNTFVLTTLDSASRITRFILEESFGDIVPAFRNKYVSTGFIIAAASALGASEGWQKIWPVFGATNQLIAALALFVISAYLVGIKKPTKYTLLPAFFMIFTSVGALGWLLYSFLTAATPNYLLAFISLSLIVLSCFIVYEAMQAFYKIRKPVEESSSS